MTKKILAVILAVMMIVTACTFAVSAEDAENAVWIEQDATGDGSEDDPMGDIAAAVAKLGGKDGTVYVYGEFNFTGFKAEWEGTVTFTGVNADSKLVVNKSGAVHFNGDTIIKDIHVECGEFAHLNTNGVKFVYDPGEELVLGNDLDNRQSHILMTIEIYGTCELAADNRTLCHNGISFGKSSINCSIEILNPLHLGNTETAAAICRFHKHRQSQTFYSLPGKSLY